jgi:hypothetical protein
VEPVVLTDEAFADALARIRDLFPTPIAILSVLTFDPGTPRMLFGEGAPGRTLEDALRSLAEMRPILAEVRARMPDGAEVVILRS